MFKSKFTLKRIALAMCLVVVLMASAPAMASNSGDEPEIYDARLQGYAQSVQLESGSTALTWLLLIVLGVLCLGVLFKDAKRSHLD